MMTKKNYEEIAKVIHRAIDRGYKTWTNIGISAELADYFKADNPRFNEDKFISACNGYKIEK